MKCPECKCEIEDEKMDAKEDKKEMKAAPKKKMSPAVLALAFNKATKK
jgi:hypothetical protein